MKTCLVWVTLLLFQDYASGVLQFDSGASVLTVPENTPIGTVLRTIRVTDASACDNLYVSIEDVNTSSVVSLAQKTYGNQVTADLILVSNLDRDFQSASRTLTLKASGCGNTAITMITMYIIDVNDNSPTFVGVGCPFLEVYENVTVGERVYQIQATDPDTGLGGLVTYHWLGSHSSVDPTGTFNLDPNTGDISLARPLDYTKKPVYKLELQAQDGGGLSRSTALIVFVHPVTSTDTVLVG